VAQCDTALTSATTLTAGQARSATMPLAEIGMMASSLWCSGHSIDNRWQRQKGKQQGIGNNATVNWKQCNNQLENATTTVTGQATINWMQWNNAAS